MHAATSLGFTGSICLSVEYTYTVTVDLNPTSGQCLDWQFQSLSVTGNLGEVTGLDDQTQILLL